MHKVHQELYIVYWGFRDNAVAKIKNVAAATSNIAQQLPGLVCNGVLFCAQHDGIRLPCTALHPVSR